MKLYFGKFYNYFLIKRLWVIVIETNHYVEQFIKLIKDQFVIKIFIACLETSSSVVLGDV